MWIEAQDLYDELLITVDEVNAITQLKFGKSAGSDLLIDQFYINGCEILASPLCYVF